MGGGTSFISADLLRHPVMGLAVVVVIPVVMFTSIVIFVAIAIVILNVTNV